MKERSWNVYENKGRLLLKPSTPLLEHDPRFNAEIVQKMKERSWNVYENKG